MLYLTNLLFFFIKINHSIYDANITNSVFQEHMFLSFNFWETFELSGTEVIAGGNIFFKMLCSIMKGSLWDFHDIFSNPFTREAFWWILSFLKCQFISQNSNLQKTTNRQYLSKSFISKTFIMFDFHKSFLKSLYPRNILLSLFDV